MRKEEEIERDKGGGGEEVNEKEVKKEREKMGIKWRKRKNEKLKESKRTKEKKKGMKDRKRV